MTTITEIPLSQLVPDPDNIREDALDNISALAADIRDKGLQNPLHVYPTGADIYMIWGGHRRWAALCMNGAAHADCIIKPPPPTMLDKLDGMVSENLHRQQLNPVEEAKVYRRYLDAGLLQGEIATRCGTAASKVSMYLKLLEELSDDELRRVAAGEISANRALKTVRERRIRAGKARADAGQQHAMTMWAPHFNSTHPLITVASAHCQNEQHHPADRIGGACGACWEWAIRRDERAAVDIEQIHPELPMPTQQPRAGTNPLSCANCHTAYRSEIKYAQCVVDDPAAGKRYVLPEHNWVHARDRAAQPA